MKTQKWFQDKLKKFKNDPEFLLEYINLLEGELAESKKPKQCTQCGMIQGGFINCKGCGWAIGI